MAIRKPPKPKAKPKPQVKPKAKPKAKPKPIKVAVVVKPPKIGTIHNKPKTKRPKK